MEILIAIALMVGVFFMGKKILRRGSSKEASSTIRDVPSSPTPATVRGIEQPGRFVPDEAYGRRLTVQTPVADLRPPTPAAARDDDDDDVRWLITAAQEDPDRALGIIDGFDQGLRDNAMMQFIRILALSTKGLRPLIEARVALNLATPEELRRYITDEAVPTLVEALEQVARLEALHPDYLPNLGAPGDRFGEARVDHLCTVVERLRPGLVQQIRGKTKLSYFSRERLGFLPGLLERAPENVLGRILESPFTYHETARSAVGVTLLPSDDNPHGMKFMLFRGLINETETLGDAVDIGMLDIYAAK